MSCLCRSLISSTQVSPLASFTSISYPFPTTGIPLGNFNSENMNAIVAYNSTWWNLDTRKNWNIDLNKSSIVLKRKCGLGALNGCTSYHYINRKAKITLSMPWKQLKLMLPFGILQALFPSKFTLLTIWNVLSTCVKWAIGLQRSVNQRTVVIERSINLCQIAVFDCIERVIIVFMALIYRNASSLISRMLLQYMSQHFFVWF